MIWSAFSKCAIQRRAKPRISEQGVCVWREKNSCDQDSRLVQAADKSSNEAKSRDGASRNPGLNEGAMPQTAFGSEQNRGAAFDGTSMDETGAPHSALEQVAPKIIEGKTRMHHSIWTSKTVHPNDVCAPLFKFFHGINN